MRRSLLLFSCGLLLAIPSGASAGDECVSGTISAELSGDEGFEGLYKYTVSITWDVTGFASPSHFDVFLGLEACDCICDPGIVQFPSPAGTSTGTDSQGAECTVQYEGSFACDGDPSLPKDSRPAVKYDVPMESDCQPDETGSGTFCFYTVFEPIGDENTMSTAGIKHGNDFCEGTLTGPVPDCTCPIAVDEKSWTSIKGQYR